MKNSLIPPKSTRICCLMGANNVKYKLEFYRNIFLSIKTEGRHMK